MGYPVLKIPITEVGAAGMSCIFPTLRSISISRKHVLSGQMRLMKSSSPVTKRYHTSNQATIWRWREAYQNDFAARMDWCVMPYSEANHPPVVRLAHENKLSVKLEQTVILDGSKSSDPDNNKLNYKWIYYGEVGSFAGSIKIQNSDDAVATFVAPKVDRAKTIHVILQVTDNGEPALTRYQRVIVEVLPE